MANIYPMTTEIAMQVGRAIAFQVKDRAHGHRIVIGKDTRLSGYMIENALAAGICSMGVDVLLVGPLPTPGIAFITTSMRADAGVVISASHNPFQDNGIKIFSRDGFKLSDEYEADIEELLHGLLGAGDIACRADGVGGSTGDDVGVLAFGFECIGNRLHLGQHVGAAGHDGDALDTHQVEKKVVARSFGAVRALDAFFEHQMAIQTFLDRPGQSQPAMVGLNRTAGNDGVGAAIEGVRDAEIKFAGFVAAGASGQEVVTLDEDIDLASKSLGKCGKGFDRCRGRNVSTTREFCQIHKGTPCGKNYFKETIASISISAPRGRAATWTALRAGNGAEKYVA